MHLRIVHRTHYQFNTDVFLEPHIVRLFPRTNPSQQLKTYNCTINPTPANQTGGIDALGNSFTQVWFNDLHAALSIEVTATVQTLRSNPFDFFLDAENEKFPVQYTPRERIHLAPFMLQADENPVESELAQVIEAVGGTSNTDVVTVASQLNRYLYENLEVEHRLDGQPFTPAQTLARGGGACRDLGVMLAALYRRCGFAARFVSGYQYAAGEEVTNELHAWTEVFFPTVGWRGFDPTTGLAVADNHVVVATGAHTLDAAPVTGSIRGNDAKCTLTATVSVTADATNDTDTAGTTNVSQSQRS